MFFIGYINKIMLYSISNGDLYIYIYSNVGTQLFHFNNIVSSYISPSGGLYNLKKISID